MRTRRLGELGELGELRELEVLGELVDLEELGELVELEELGELSIKFLLNMRNTLKIFKTWIGERFEESRMNHLPTLSTDHLHNSFRTLPVQCTVYSVQNNVVCTLPVRC